MENEIVSGADPAARWLAVHDELLRGITHAFSNRIATIGATAYMLEHGDVPVGQAVESMRAETDRMDTLLQQLRQLPGRPGAEPEPMTVNDVCANAVKTHSHHGELRDFECDIEVDPDVYPIWAEPHQFTHALLVALNAAKRNAMPGTRVLIRATGDVNTVKVQVTARDPLVDGLTDDTGANALDAAAAGWLIAQHGGLARALPHGCELETPTLLAIRRARKK